MRPKETPALSSLLPLVLSFLLVGLLAGCGGSDESGSDQPGGGGQDQKQEGKAAEKVTKKEPLQRKVAIGTVRAFKDDKRRLSLRPAADAQGKKPLGFKVRKNASITLDGKEAELGDIEQDQQAQITYVVKNEVNRAITLHLFNKQPPGGDEKTKQPSEEGEKPKQPSGGGEKTG